MLCNSNHLYEKKISSSLPYKGKIFCAKKILADQSDSFAPLLVLQLISIVNLYSLLTKAVMLLCCLNKRKEETDMNAASQLRPEFIVDAKGRKKAVVIPFDTYEKLMEDLADLAVAAERREERTVSSASSS